MTRDVIWSTTYLALLSFSQSPPGKGTIDQSLGQRVASVLKISDETLAREYPKERSDLDFFAGRFSHDGALLALVLKNIEIGDPEQVWLYDLRAHRLVPVTEPHESLLIRDIAWSEDGTLYVSAARFSPGNVQEPFFIAATMSKMREIAVPPRGIAEIFKGRSKRLHFNVDCCQEQFDRYQEQSDKYVVKVSARGHGSHTLYMRRTNVREWADIVDGGFELLTFLFDPGRSEVLYPEIGRIVVFDLQSRQRRSFLDLAKPVFPLLLDQSEDRRMLAYVVPGDCLSDRPQEKAKNSRHVCLAALR